MLGILYDIHGNLDALNAALADAGAAGVDRWLFATCEGDFTFRRTGYDVDAAAAAYRAMGDFGEFAAARIEKGSD